ncbi:restriction endonuclease subunit S [Collinsella stercoris]|uniref:Type I restriction modification DNA specificity domain protein n=1 Tax=Collinsella stercoris DSM 13279 TaxID=445975 RepID=B6G8T9_9ACTN|nr:restriction endonuclease subunit S [Collinsella stercoris]EEA91338.1 type I restriction modification DNA specificity domain protein [Collinsella stercoris DSM 13279]UEA44666.1 restriction endonuclease subunit S [Collinsella stercoris DSM 13279]UWP10868.1 restriction endonuclease subunit S [Collinsella stercoris]
MAKKTNVPEIRFAGFTDPWEQRKLGEVAHRVIRKNEGNQSDLPLTISAQHGLVDQRDYFNNQVASRDMSGYYLLENGEFAYNKSTSGDSPWGAIKRLTKYEKGCLSTLYICFGLDQGDPDFLVTYYETNRWHGAVQMIAAEGARNHGLLNIAPDDFFETALTLPCLTEEQKQIGCFFTQLVSLITLHQRKYDKLCAVKKSMLDKMFPKPGETKPEIRFDGFTDPWEQRKLGSVAASFDYGLNAAATEYDGQNKYLRITDIDDTTHEFLKSDLTTPLADLAMSADYLLEEGDLLFARTGASVGKTYLYRQYDGTVYFAGFLIRARIGESADPEFVYQATLTDAYKKYVAITSQRSGQPGVNAQEYADYQLMLPSRTEQQQIGMTLRSLDNFITLHQRKLNLLRNTKKSLLDKMFV